MKTAWYSMIINIFFDIFFLTVCYKKTRRKKCGRKLRSKRNQKTVLSSSFMLLLLMNLITNMLFVGNLFRFFPNYVVLYES